MASLPTLREFMTCPVCQELFKEPKVLQCQHSLCSQCVKLLIKNTLKTDSDQCRVSCPICRCVTKAHQVRPDLKTNCILETQEAQNVIKSDNSEKIIQQNVKLCELCERHLVNIECRNCNKVICEECCKIHNEIPACKLHQLVPLTHMVQKQKSFLYEIKNKLQRAINSISQTSKILTSYEKNVESLCGNFLKTIKEWKQKQETNVSEKYELAADKILKNRDDDMRDIILLKQQLNEITLSMRENIALINQLNHEKNPPEFLGQAERIIQKYHEYPALDNLSNIPESIKQSKLMNVEIIIHSNDKIEELEIKTHKKKRLNPLQYFTPVHSNNIPFPKGLLHQHSSSFWMKTEGFVKNLLFHQGDLFCLFEDRIEVYNMQGIWQRCIENLFQANGLTILHNEFVIATMGFGLQIFKLSGKSTAVLKDGAFCDVTTDQKKTVYALDYNDNTPSIVTFSKDYLLNKWTQKQNIKLPYTNLNPYHTILWNGSFLLTTHCSDEQGQILRFHHSGIILEEYAFPQSMPRLCCADTDSRDVIIANSIQNQLSLLNINGQNKVIELGSKYNGRNNLEHSGAFNVTVDGEQAFWISFTTSKTLVRYSLSTDCE